MRRRSMMILGQEQEKSEWDYELYAEQEGGRVGHLKIPVTQSQDITIEYDATEGTTYWTGYIYDARSCGSTYLRTYQTGTKIGTVEYTVEKTGTITIGVGGGWSDGDYFTGKYIKMKFN